MCPASQMATMRDGIMRGLKSPLTHLSLSHLGCAPISVLFFIRKHLGQ